MNSRERIAASLRHQPTDKIAVDFAGSRQSGIAAIAYAKLKKHLGITSGDIYVYDMMQQLAIVEPEVLDIFDVDCIELGRAFLLQPDDWRDWELPDGTPCKIPAYVNLERKQDTWYVISPDGRELGCQPPGCLYFEQTYFPFETKTVGKVDLLDELPRGMADHMRVAAQAPGRHFPLDERGLRKLSDAAKTLHDSTDRAILGVFGGNMFELPQCLFRMDRYFMDMGLDPAGIITLSERICELHLQLLDKWLPAVKDCIDIVGVADDLGGQHKPLMSPAMYRKYYKPYHARIWRRIKEIAPHVRISMHCCGAITSLLDDLIDAGLDAINPVQITCEGMSAENLMAKFGGRIVFCGGGCDTRDILPNGTPEQVREHVLGQLRHFAPRKADGTFTGGFIFQQVHNIQANVPPENIVAMFEAVREYAND